MRTLEDWFKYLEQQYVDEKAPRKEPQPETTLAQQEPVGATTETEQPAPLADTEMLATIDAEPASALQPDWEEMPTERPATAAAIMLEQVQVEEVAVPDPADYIFTLRRSSGGDQSSLAETSVLPAEASAVQEPVAETTVSASSEMASQSSADETAAPQPEETRIDVPAATQRPPRAKPTKRAPYTRSVQPVPPPQSIEELWQRVPKHVRLLVELGDDEVTQRYYDRRFKESRRELVERLLNPPLTLEDTARLLGVCPTTVRRYTERGLLNHYRTPGNQRRFRLSDVIAFLEARQQAQEARRRKR
ncbi:MAG: helix-turn-helix domain-containing protein [Armatimonadota bacterium]|nr:helix-turn-helix domain-containing protein [bacterium]MDW8104922.1 helix-turn-helix domain-containing protein [Armatimonadota bacterium]MDW8291129.1 helix-turn-helix domain-containing protein [Armatimonadota bacterium]